MAIDWLTVAAQIVNFLILVWLLKRFLYQRVIDAMAARERRIAERMAEAQQRTDEAERSLKDYRQKRRELDAEHEQVLAAAQAEADALRKRQREALRAEIETTRKTWLEQVERDQATFLTALRKQAAERFLEVARRALGDLADADLEAQMVAHFLDRLRRADRSMIDDLASACRASGEPVHVFSSFELPPALQRKITGVVHDDLGDDLEVEYRVSNEITCGLELSGGGRSILWSLDGYLDSLERQLSRMLGDSGASLEADRLASEPVPQHA